MTGTAGPRPAAAGGDEAPTQSLPAGPALIRLSTTIGARVLAARSRSGLSAHQLQTLRLAAVAAAAPGVAMSDLAEALAVSRSTATSVVDQLVASHLAVRAPDDLDKRILRVRSTADGVRALQAFDADVRTSVATLLRTLSDDKRRRLDELLVHLDPPTRTIPLG